MKSIGIKSMQVTTISTCSRRLCLNKFVQSFQKRKLSFLVLRKSAILMRVFQEALMRKLQRVLLLPQMLEQAQVQTLMSTATTA
uniref:Uncharacterized protein n=1 Tax=Arundo donax TaxID=35708 RepID=A0A0A9DDX2_ARUDO